MDKEDDNMSDRVSPYVDYDWSDRYVSGQTSGGSRTMSEITKITVHCYDGCGTSTGPIGGWISGGEVSSNYLIGEEGDVCLFIPEEYRGHTSANFDNDFHAITIEVSNKRGYTSGPRTDPTAHELAPKAYEKLILVCADICKRYNFRLNYDGTANGSLTCHWMFTDNRSCPGGWFMGRINDFCDKVNALLSGGTISSSGGDDLDDISYTPNIIAYDYYLVTKTEKATKPGECGNRISESVFLGRW